MVGSNWYLMSSWKEMNFWRHLNIRKKFQTWILRGLSFQLSFHSLFIVSYFWIGARIHRMFRIKIRRAAFSRSTASFGYQKYRLISRDSQCCLQDLNLLVNWAPSWSSEGGELQLFSVGSTVVYIFPNTCYTFPLGKNHWLPWYKQVEKT